MLARANRVVSGDEYRRLSRRGVRVNGGGFTALGQLTDQPTEPTRFGFIITKRVGSAVRRNRIRRRLKAICRELLAAAPTGLACVIRVYPEAAEDAFAVLRDGVRQAVLALARRLEVPVIEDAAGAEDAAAELSAAAAAGAA